VESGADEISKAVKLARQDRPGLIRRSAAQALPAAGQEASRPEADDAGSLRTTAAAPADAASARSSAPADAAAPAGEVARTRVVAIDAAVARRNRVLPPGAEDAPARAYKMLRTQVLQLLGRQGVKSLAIVSPRADDGRTVTAINLAAAIGEDPGHTALLVDLDLRSPSVAACLGLQPKIGVAECLRGESAIEEALVRPRGYERLTLLPAKEAVRQSSDLLAAARTQSIARELHARYANRIVLYDLPPLLTSDDALCFLPHVGSALLVVREGGTRREDVVRCLELMRATTVVGTVLNGSRERRPLDD